MSEVLALDSQDAHVLASWKVERPNGLAARNGKLFILHTAGDRPEVLSLSLGAGWEKQQPALLFQTPQGMKPYDIEADSHGRIYLSDSGANHVYQFDPQGKPLRTYGRLNAQKPGAYDPETFMAPEKLACWTDAQGQDRIVVIEMEGPNRLSEWSAEGKLLRQCVVPQTQANDGYAVDPRHGEIVYMPGHRNSLVRWKIDYATGQWTPEAVWSNVGQTRDGKKQFEGMLAQSLAAPRIIYHGNDVYLAYWRGYIVYHLEGDHWRACAGIVTPPSADKKTKQYYLWRDTNGDGTPQEDEYLPYATTLPQGVLRYFGETWFDDLSLVCMGQKTTDIWRLSPSSFDSRGTPIFEPNSWQKLLTDPTFVEKAAGTAIATYGGNELGTSFDSAWASVCSSTNGDIYVSARSGPGFSSNYGAQAKLSRYVPDGKGGYTQRWRVGRIALKQAAISGEVNGPIFVCPPVNGLIGWVDSCRAGLAVYTEDGMYVDMLFPDARDVPAEKRGAYTAPGEFFTGYTSLNPDNGKVYIAFGKVTPHIYEAAGWTASQNPVKRIKALDQSVTLAANQIASAPEIALQIRGGAAASSVARVYAAPGGGPAMDGSMAGWEACDPMEFSAGESQQVEARCYYDPDHLFIRWHARLGHAFQAKSLDLPQHIFAHDRGNDTLGLYLQGDPNAAPGASKPGGRPGDVRFVFGIFKNGATTSPVVLGMYPKWNGPGATPQTYATANSVTFEHVGIVPGVVSGYKVDDDGKGFVLAASIPRTAIPGAPALNGWKTRGNFDANLGGLNRFWWSNSDGSASRETFDEPTEARLFPGSWSEVQCLGIDNLPIHSWKVIGPFGSPAAAKFEYDRGRADVVRVLAGTVFPPDTVRDWTAKYDDDLTQTRTAHRKLEWKAQELSVDQVDFVKVLNWKGFKEEGVVYMATHIYAPEPLEVKLQIVDFHGQATIRAQLNGQGLPQGKGKDLEHRPEGTLALHAGWNELVLREERIWGESRLGACLLAAPETLWKLRVQGSTPTPEKIPAK